MSNRIIKNDQSIKENSTIRLLQDIRDLNLKKDDVGAVIMKYEQPELAYEVEFCDDNGNTLVQTVLKPNQISLLKTKTP